MRAIARSSEAEGPPCKAGRHQAQSSPALRRRGWSARQVRDPDELFSMDGGDGTVIPVTVGRLDDPRQAGHTEHDPVGNRPRAVRGKEYNHVADMHGPTPHVDPGPRLERRQHRGAHHGDPDTLWARRITLQPGLRL